MTIDAYDLIASKMIGYRGKLGIPDTTPCVWGSGSIPPVAVILGGNPDGSSVSAKLPFMGIHGQMLMGFLQGAGLEWENVYRTYAIKFQPERGGTGRAAELREAAWPFLKKELKVIGRACEADMVRPPFLLVMGQTPALMLGWTDLTRLRSGQIRTAKIGKQQWTCLVTTDIAEATAGRVKAAMAEDFGTLAGLIDGSVKPDVPYVPPMVPRGHSSLDLPKPEPLG